MYPLIGDTRVDLEDNDDEAMDGNGCQYVDRCQTHKGHEEAMDLTANTAHDPVSGQTGNASERRPKQRHDTVSYSQGLEEHVTLCLEGRSLLDDY